MLLVFLTFFFPSDYKLSGAATAFFPEFIHRLAEGSLDVCQEHLAMHLVNYSNERMSNARK